jgi:hypothetical protein
MLRSYGFLLEELGFYPNLLNPMLERYIHPLAAVLYPGARRRASCVKHHHAHQARPALSPGPGSAGRDG